jgi:hypothetical protein
MASMADVFGFGSNVRTETSDIFFGPWQAGGLIGGFVIASLGVLIYAVTGPIENGEPPEEQRVEKEKSAEPEQPPLLEKV